MICIDLWSGMRQWMMLLNPITRNLKLHRDHQKIVNLFSIRFNLSNKNEVILQNEKK